MQNVWDRLFGGGASCPGLGPLVQSGPSLLSLPVAVTCMSRWWKEGQRKDGKSHSHLFLSLAFKIYVSAKLLLPSAFSDGF